MVYEVREEEDGVRGEVRERMVYEVR